MDDRKYIVVDDQDRGWTLTARNEQHAVDKLLQEKEINIVPVLVVRVAEDPTFIMWNATFNVEHKYTVTKKHAGHF